MKLPGLRHRAANGIASQGDGRSRNMASATAESTSNPSVQTSRWQTVTSVSSNPCAMNSSRALCTRCS